MDNEKLAMVVKRLAEKTKKQQLTWQETEKKDVFQAAFAQSTVRLAEERATLYRISIFNEEGNLIDTATDEELSGVTLATPFTIMRDMFSLVRRQAMGVDKALDSLLEEIGE